jgi:hypothetical protein
MNISYEILQVIANECYKTGNDCCLWAARAFEELLKIDTFGDYGACVGHFRYVVEGHAHGVHPKHKDGLKGLTEVLDILETSSWPKSGEIESKQILAPSMQQI